MIFNFSSGGMAYINVTAPSGATITATCQGLVLTGSGTCVIEVPMIGLWHLVCSFSGSADKSADIDVQSYGVTYPVTFSYSSTITVTTLANAAVTATKGQETMTGTADSNGICVLTVLVGGLGNWGITARLNNVTDNGNVYVTSYGNDFPITITLCPDITVTAGGNTYRYTGSAISDANLTITPVNGTGWKLWMRTSGTICFNKILTAVDYCVVGKGATGGFYHYDTVLSTDYGGDGGAGGAVVSARWSNLVTGHTYSITVNANGTSIGGVQSVGVGGGAAGGCGGEMYVSYSGPGSGRSGQYAFGSTSFDNVEYGHGGYGGDVNGGGAGTGARGRTDSVWGNPGAGGAGGGQSNNRPTGGNNGIVLMRSAA